MRYACRRGYHDRCPAKWCTCPCHQLELAERLEGATGGGDAIEQP